MSRGSPDRRELARLRLQLAAARLDEEISTMVTAPTLGLAALAGLVAGLVPGDLLSLLGRGLLAVLGSASTAASTESAQSRAEDDRSAA